MAHSGILEGNNTTKIANCQTYSARKKRVADPERSLVIVESCKEYKQGVNLMTMLKNWLLAFTLILLVLTLSGCTAIGSDKSAALQVTSVPEASVFLDGKHLGKTPFFSDQLRAGEHLLKITVSEASYLEKVTLNAGTLTVVNRELANNFLAQAGEVLWLEPNKKGLFISSQPGQADLIIDGKRVGETPYFSEEIADGEHKVLVTKTGFRERQFAIKTAGDYQLIADVTLASEIAKDISLTAANPSPSPVPKVEVTQTPQGFLRVRKEPSLTAPEIGRVKTGDQLEVIQETTNWLKVKFEGKQGWISSQYTKKLP